MPSVLGNTVLSDLISKPGDPLVSPDGNTTVNANNDGTITISGPQAATTKTVATADQIQALGAHTLYELEIGDASTPASSVQISEDYNFYKFWVGSNGVFPSLSFSFPTLGSVATRFPFTILAGIDSSASTLTAPTGVTWSWTSGAGLPTASFAGKWIAISCLIRTDLASETNPTVMAACWRCQ